MSMPEDGNGEQHRDGVKPQSAIKKQRREDPDEMIARPASPSISRIEDEELVEDDIELMAQQGTSPIVAEAQLTTNLETMVEVAKKKELETSVDATKHEGKTFNHDHKVAFITSLVPDQKSQLTHTGVRAGTVQPPTEQTRISIKVHTNNLDEESKEVLGKVVENHSFNIKAKSAAAVLKFIEKCAKSSIVLSLEFNLEAIDETYRSKFTPEQVVQIKGLIEQAKKDYKENHSDQDTEHTEPKAPEY